MKTTHNKLLLGAALLASLCTGHAQDAGQDWEFSATLPFWAAGLDGDVSVGGATQNVDIGFSDLAEKLDASASVALGARKGALGLFGSIGYLKFAADGDLPGGGSTQAESEFTVADLAASYVVYMSDSDRPLVLEVLGGARYIGLTNSIEIRNGAGNVLFSRENTHDLIDPIIGFRGTKGLTDKLHLDFAADVGGFDLSENQSELHWSAITLLAYDFNDWFTLSGGYKVLAVDASNDKTGLRELGVDAKLSGAIIAATFKF
ncbi:MAG: hypothetical protein MUE42_00865 [Opitutaceae bacterium]|jgi:hypothetical protein|nr:hypothetical protein [Opitutaceae bacterium]